MHWVHTVQWLLNWLVCALGTYSTVGTDIRFGVSGTVAMKNAALGYGYIEDTTYTTQQTNTS